MAASNADPKGSHLHARYLLTIALVIAIVCGFILSSCASDASSASLIQTHTQIPRKPSIAPVSNTNYIEPTSTQVTQTDVPALSACATTLINVREGPGTQYAKIGGLLFNACVKILGRNEDSNWAYIIDDNQMGWVAGWLLTIDGNINEVSVQNVYSVIPTYTVTAVAVLPPQQSSSSENQDTSNSGGSSSGGSSSDSSGQDYPAGATAICNDGTYSYSAHRQGTCSHHGGVAIWLH